MPSISAVRVVAQDVAVLERARLALVGVADDVLVAGELLRHEAPLEPGREARAAAAAQRALLHLGDHRRRRDLLGEDLPQRLVAAALRRSRRAASCRPLRPASSTASGPKSRNSRGAFTFSVPRRRAARLRPGPRRPTARRPARRASRRPIQLHIRLLFTSSTGRIAAGAHALAFLEREPAVLRRLAEADAEPSPSGAPPRPSPPDSAHGRLVQTVSLKRPVGLRSYIA